jgi:hypothetical protein
VSHQAGNEVRRLVGLPAEFGMECAIPLLQSYRIGVEKKEDRYGQGEAMPAPRFRTGSGRILR